MSQSHLASWLEGEDDNSWNASHEFSTRGLEFASRTTSYERGSVGNGTVIEETLGSCDQEEDACMDDMEVTMTNDDETWDESPSEEQEEDASSTLIGTSNSGLALVDSYFESDGYLDGSSLSRAETQVEAERLVFPAEIQDTCPPANVGALAFETLQSPLVPPSIFEQARIIARQNPNSEKECEEFLRQPPEIQQRELKACLDCLTFVGPWFGVRRRASQDHIALYGDEDQDEDGHI